MRTRGAALLGSASLIAVAMFCGGCAPAGSTGTSTGTVAGKRSAVPVAAPGQPVAAPSPAGGIEQPDPAKIPAGSVYRNPRNNRNEIVLADVRHTAVLIGDSQSEPEGSWPRRALAALGYTVFYAGKSGTGYVAGLGSTGNYIDALENGDWLLPYGSPPLIVVQGGGNDARRGADDAQITGNANRLLSALQTRYPGSRLIMIGTLARGTGDRGRRAEVDALLGRIAAKADVQFISAGDWINRYDVGGDLVDGIHLNASGHRKLAAVLSRRLSELGVAADGTES